MLKESPAVHLQDGQLGFVITILSFLQAVRRELSYATLRTLAGHRFPSVDPMDRDHAGGLPNANPTTGCEML